MRSEHQFRGTREKSAIAIISRRTSAEFLSLTPVGQQQLFNFMDMAVYVESQLA